MPRAPCPIVLLLGIKTPATLFGRLSPGERIVDALFHDVACPEHQYAPRRDGNFLARLWVAADALTLVANPERAERREFHGVAALEARHYLAEHQLDDLGGLVPRQTNLLKHRFRQVGARECLPAHCVRSPSRGTNQDANRASARRSICPAIKFLILHHFLSRCGFRAAPWFSRYQRSSTAPQVKPPPMASSSTRSPVLMRPSERPWLNANGIEAADVLACLSTVMMMRSGSRPSF